MASNLNSIKKKIAGMSKVALRMWELAHDAFMEHDTDLITVALDEEEKLNGLEKSITEELAKLGRTASDESERKRIQAWMEIVGDLELIGDYCKDTLERIEIKIKEKLLFSEEAVKEYSHLYNETEKVLASVVEALGTDDFGVCLKAIKENVSFKELLELYRRHHEERMIKGICLPFAHNMYLNMLDFADQTFEKSREIAAILQRLR